MATPTGLRGYLWGQRWNILLTTQFIFTCGIVYNRYQENQAAPPAMKQPRPLRERVDKQQ
ncbi:hypothetical protein PC129_g20926 [Phytophthora cactorum]|uniref:Uncharacterized protein n=1 Tax=Phytophthora cactorum TaxID=29920 RepID=A0A329RDC2_9STRA|nr:hypothetical protein GQ600_7365 [Phytophthora cactorum]KAG3153724.1 hypothetical protein PI126_g9940 [Phytophthora idaei]KAG2761106.1 hypothetical protein Pcac1_g26976 [Phytophthora cactorum]KAG3208041.1 hypothetical protein PC129_g20926 [Phytophthora cactorum]KAG3244293.1 hypothetical protein PI124_g10921 [Phytophthora idaei]